MDVDPLLVDDVVDTKMPSNKPLHHGPLKRAPSNSEKSAILSDFPSATNLNGDFRSKPDQLQEIGMSDQNHEADPGSNTSGISV